MKRFMMIFFTMSAIAVSANAGGALTKCEQIAGDTDNKAVSCDDLKGIEKVKCKKDATQDAPAGAVGRKAR